MRESKLAGGGEARMVVAKPVVNGLKPTMGPSNGGGRQITVRGDHLGLDAADILGKEG